MMGPQAIGANGINADNDLRDDDSVDPSHQVEMSR